MAYAIGTKPGVGIYRCIGCQNWTVTLDADEKRLPPCGNCGSGQNVTYLRSDIAFHAQLRKAGQRFGLAILAGFMGTGIMTTLSMLGPIMGLPKMDVAGMLSNFMGSLLGSSFAAPAIGWVAHFAIGLMLALIYAFVFVKVLPGSTWVRGALYGLLPFLVAQIVVMPMMGMGFFTANAPNAAMLVLGSLMGHLLYGLFVGGIYGNPNRHLP